MSFYFHETHDGHVHLDDPARTLADAGVREGSATIDEHDALDVFVQKSDGDTIGPIHCRPAEVRGARAALSAVAAFDVV